MTGEFEARVNKIVLPQAERITHPPERFVVGAVPYRPVPYRPVYEPHAPAWLFSALAWMGRAFHDGGMAQRRFATWVAGSDVDPYAQLGATRLFLIVRVGEQLRLTIAAHADADAPGTGGTLYSITDAGITDLYKALAASPVFAAVRYCYVPGLAAPPTETELATVYVQAASSGYDPATGLRAILTGSAVAQAVPLKEFESTGNEQVYDRTPDIVPIASSLVYDLTNYNELGATSFALPTLYSRERLDDGAEVVNKIGAQAVVYSGGPGYDAATAQTLAVQNTATTVVDGQAVTRSTYASSVAVSIVPLTDSADIPVTALTCTSATPWSAFSQQQIVGFYRAADWQRTYGVPIYDYGQANGSFAPVAAAADAKGAALLEPTLVFDPQHSALSGGTLDAVVAKLRGASYLVSTDRLAAMLHSAITSEREGEFGLRVMTAALSFATKAVPKLEGVEAEAITSPQQHVQDSSLFVYTDLDLTASSGDDIPDSQGIYLASAVLNSTPDDRSSSAFAPARVLMGLVRPVRTGSGTQYAFVPEDDSVVIDGVRYLLSVITLDDLTVDPNSRPYPPVFWPRTRFWQFANRHNPYRDVEYAGETQAERIKRAQNDTARIGRATAQAGEPMHMYLDTRESMRVWPIYGFPYTHATRTVDKSQITAISDAVRALLGQQFAPAGPTVVDGLDAERVAVPGVLTLDNPFTTEAATAPDDSAAANDGVRAQAVQPEIAGRAVRNLAVEVIAPPLVTTIDAHVSSRDLAEQQSAAAVSAAKSLAAALPVEQQRDAVAEAAPIAIAAARKYQSVYGFSVINARAGEAYLVEVVEADLTPPDRLPRPTENRDYDPYYVRVVFLNTLTSYNMTIIVPTVAYDQHRHLGRQGETYDNVISHTDELELGYLYSLYDTTSNFDELTFHSYPPGGERAELAYSKTVLFSNVPYSLPQDTSVSPLDLFKDVSFARPAGLVERTVTAKDVVAAKDAVAKPEVTKKASKKAVAAKSEVAQEVFGELIHYRRLTEPPAYFLCRRQNWNADCHLMQSTHTDGSAVYLAFGAGDIVPLRLDAAFDIDKRQPAHLYKLTTTFADRQYDAATTISVSNTPYVISVSTATGTAEFASLSINPTAGTADISLSANQALTFPTDCYVVGQASTTLTSVDDVNSRLGSGLGSTGDFASMADDGTVTAQFQVLTYDGLVYLIRAVSNVAALGAVGSGTSTSGLLIDTFVPATTGNLKLAQAARHKRSGMRFFGASYTPTTMADTPDSLDFTSITGETFFAPTVVIPIPELDASKPFVADLSNFLGEQFWTFIYSEVVASPGQTVNGVSYADGLNVDADGKPILSLQKLQFVYDSIAVLFTPNDLTHKYPLLPKQQILALTNGQLMEGLCWRTDNVQPDRLPPANVAAQQTLSDGDGMDRANIVYSRRNRPVSTPAVDAYLGMSVNSIVSLAGSVYRIEESAMSNDQTGAGFISAVSSNANMVISVLFDYDNNELGTLAPYDPTLSNKGMVFLNGYLSAGGYAFSSPDHFDVNDVLPSQLPLLEQITELMGGNWDVAFYNTDVSLPREFWSLTYDAFTAPGLPNYITDVPPAPADPTFANRTRSLLLNLQNPVRADGLNVMDTYSSVVSTNVHLSNGVTGSVFLSKKADRDVASLGVNPTAAQPLSGLPTKYDFFIFSRDHYWTLKGASFELIDQGYAMCLVDDGSGTGTKVAKYFIDSDGNYNELYTYVLFSPNGGVIESGSFTAKVTLGAPANPAAAPPLPETPNNVNPQDIVAQLNKVSNLIYAAFGPASPGQPPAYLPIQAVGGGVQAAPIMGAPGFNGYLLNVMSANRQPVQITQLYSGSVAYPIAGSTTTAPLNPKTGKASPFLGSLSHGLDKQASSSPLQSADGTVVIPRPTVPAGPAGVFGGNGLGGIIGTPLSVAFQGSGAIPPAIAANPNPGTTMRADDTVFYTYNAATNALMDSAGKSATPGGGLYFVDDTDPDNPVYGALSWPKFTLNSNSYAINLATTALDGVSPRYSLVVGGRTYPFDADNLHVTVDNTVFTFNPIRGGTYSVTVAAAEAPAGAEAPSPIALTPFTMTAGGLTATIDVFNYPGGLNDVVLGVLGRQYSYDAAHGTITVTSGATSTTVPVRTGLIFASNSGYGYVLSLIDGEYAVNGTSTCRYSASTSGAPATYELLTDPQIFTRGGNFYVFDQNSSGQYLSVTGAGRVFPINPYQFSINGVVYIINTNATPNTVIGGGNVYPMSANNTQFVLNGAHYTIALKQNSLNGATVSGQFNVTQGNVVVIENYVYELDTLNGQIVGNGTAYPLTTSGLTYTITTDEDSFTVTTHPDAATVTIGGVDYLIGNTTVVADGVTYPVLPYRTFADGADSFVVQPDGTVARPEKFTLTGNAPYLRATFTDGGETYTVNDTATFDGTNYYRLTGTPARFTAAGHTYTLRTDGVAISAGPSKTYLIDPAAAPNPNQFAFGTETIFFGRSTDLAAFDGENYFAISHGSFTDNVRNLTFTVTGNIAVNEGNSYEIFSNLGAGAYFEVPGVATYLINIAVADTGSASGDIFSVFPISGGQFTIPLEYSLAIAAGAVTVSAPTFPGGSAVAPDLTVAGGALTGGFFTDPVTQITYRCVVDGAVTTFVDSANASYAYDGSSFVASVVVATGLTLAVDDAAGVFPVLNSQFTAGGVTYTTNATVAYINAAGPYFAMTNGRFVVPAAAPVSDGVYTVRGNSVTKGYALSADDEFSVTGEVIYTVNAVNVVRATEDVALAGNEPSQTLTDGAAAYTLDATTHLASIEPAGLTYNAAAHSFTVSYAGVEVDYTVAANSVTDNRHPANTFPATVAGNELSFTDTVTGVSFSFDKSGDNPITVAFPYTNRFFTDLLTGSTYFIDVPDARATAISYLPETTSYAFTAADGKTYLIDYSDVSVVFPVVSGSDVNVGVATVGGDEFDVHVAGVAPAGGDPEIPVNKNSFEINGNRYSITGAPNGADYSQCHVVGHGMTPRQFSTPNTFVLTDPAIVYTLHLDADNLPESVVATFPVRPSRDLLNVNDNVYVITYTGTTTGTLLGRGQSALPIVNSGFTLSNPLDSTKAKFTFADLNIYDAASVVGQFGVYVAPTFFLDGATFTLDPANRLVTDSDKRPYPLITDPSMFSVNNANYVIDTNQVPHAIVGNNNVSPIATDVTVEAGRVLPHSTFTLGGQIYEYVEDGVGNLLAVTGTKTYLVAQPALTFKLDSSLVFTINQVAPAAGNYPGSTVPIGTVTAGATTLNLYAGGPESGGADYFTYKNVLYTLIASAGTYVAVQKTYTVYSAHPLIGQQQLAVFNLNGATCLVTDGTTPGAASALGINPSTLWAATAVTANETQFGLVYGLGAAPVNVTRSAGGVFQFQATDPSGTTTLYDVIYTAGANDNRVKVDVPALLPNFTQSFGFTFTSSNPLTFETGGYNAFTTFVDETATPVESFSAAYKTPVLSNDSKVDELVSDHGDLSLEFWHSIPAGYVGPYHPVTYSASTTDPLVYYVDVDFDDPSDIYLAVNNTVMKATVTPPVFSSQWRHVAMTYEQPYTMTCTGDGFEVKKAGNYNFIKEFSVGLTFAASDVNTKQGLVYKGTGSASTPPQLAMSYCVAIEDAAVTLQLTDGEFAISPPFRGQAVLQPDTFYEVLVVKRTTTPLGNTESTDPYAPPFHPADVANAASGGSSVSITAVPTDSDGTLTVSDVRPAGAGANTDAARFLQNIGGSQEQAYTIDISVRTVNDDGTYGPWQTESIPHSVTGGDPAMLVNSTGSAHLLIGSAYDERGSALPLGGSGRTGNIRDLYLFNSAIDPTGVGTSSGVVAIADASSNDLVKSGIVGYWAAKYDADGVVNNPLDDTAVAISLNASRASLAPLSGREFEGTKLYVNGTAMMLSRVTGSAIPSSMPGYSAGDSQLVFNAGTYKLEEISMWRSVRQPYQVIDDMFGRLIPSNEPNLIVYLSGSFDVQGIAEPILPLNKYIDRVLVKNAVASMDLAFSPASLDLAGCPAIGRCGPLVTPNLYTPPGVALTLCDSGPALTTYSVTLNSVTGALAGVLNEAYVYIKDHVLTLYAGKKVGDLVLSWVSQEQGDVQLIGYVEGAPPAPMANLTNKSSYAGATSLTFTAPTSVTLKYSDSTELSDDTKWDFTLGEGAKLKVDAAIAPIGFGVSTGFIELDLAFTEKVSLDNSTADSWQSTSTEKLDESNKYTVKLQGAPAPFTNDSFMASLNTQSTASNTVGTPASKTPILPNPNLGGFTSSNPPAAVPKPPTEERFGSRMFVPSPYGQAFVSSQTLDIYQQTLLQSNTVYGFVAVPNAEIPRDLNIVSFRLSSKYLRPGCLDGVVGYEYNPATMPTGAQTYATSTGQMELAYDSNFSAGEVGHDASYMRIVEAYSLKRQVDQQAYNALAKYQTAYNGSARANDPGLTPGLDFYNEYLWSSRGGTQEVKHTYTTSLDEQMTTSTVDSTAGNLAFNVKLIASFITVADFTASWTDTIKSTVKYQFNSTAQASFDISANFDGIENDTQMRYASANDAHFVMNNNSMYNPNNQSGLDLVIGSDGLVYNIVPSVSSGAGLPVSDNIDTTLDYTQPQPSYTSGNATGLTGALQPYDRPGKTNLFRTLVFFLQPTKQNANDFWDTVVDPVWLANSPDPDAEAMRSAVANISMPWRLLYRVTFSERFLAPTTAGSLAVPQITPVMAVPVLDSAGDFLFQAIDADQPRPLHNPANDIEANIVLAAPTTSGVSAGTIQGAGPNTGLPLLPNNVIPFDLVKGASALVNWGDTANTKLITQLLTSALGLNVLPLSTTVLPGSTKVADVLDPVHGNVLYTSYADPNGVTVNVPTDFGITVYQDVNGNPIQYFDGHSFWSLQADYVASPDGSVMYYIEPPASYDQSAFDLAGDYDLFGHPGDQWRYYLVSGFSSDLTSDPTVTGTGPFMSSVGASAYTGFTIATSQHADTGAKQVAGYVLVKGIMQWPHLNSNAETFADVCVYKAMSLLDAFPVGDPEVLVSFLKSQYPQAPFADNADVSLVFARNIVSYFNAAQQALLPQ